MLHYAAVHITLA